MRLEKLSLANFKGFEQLDLNFEKDITVLAGINGIGKSSILYAICVLLSRALPEFTPSRSKPRHFEDSDIYLDRVLLEAFLRFSVSDKLFDSAIRRVRTGDDEGDSFALFRPAKEKLAITNIDDFRTALQSRTLTGDLEQDDMENHTLLASLKKDKNQPIAVYFSPSRRLPGKPRTLPEQKAFSIAQAYSFALDDREVELRDFLHWFNVQSKFGKKDNILTALKHVVAAFIPDFQGLRLEETPNLTFAVQKNGQPFQLQQLSDGERGLLAIIFDLTRRLAIANPEASDPISEGSAVVLIDEIELHLHPTWQRQVLERLTSTFKECQFIITTHSPLVLGEVQARSVRFLEREEDAGKIFSTIPLYTYGRDANEILNEMGAVERNIKVNESLHDLFKLIDDEEFDKARQAMTPLIDKLGESNPEITRARSLIKFLEGGE